MLWERWNMAAQLQITLFQGDELKLNNVFYKLGRHDTDLEGMDGNLRHLTESSRRIEAKLNKHAYSVSVLSRLRHQDISHGF